MIKKQIYSFVLLIVTLLFSYTPANAQETILIGIAPHSSARIILESHASLSRFLEARFGQPVQIVTAPNFSEFTRRSLEGQYDLLITSPHLALLAQEHVGYIPLLTYTQGLETVLVSKTDVLPNKHPLLVTGLDPVSFVTLTGLNELKERGLTVETGLQISYASASDSAALAVIQEKTDVAIMSWPNYTKLNDEIKKQVAVSWRSEPKPSRIYLAKAGKGIDAAAWQGAINAFSTSPEGVAHLADNKLAAFRPVTKDELTSVRPLADAAFKYLTTTSTESSK
jgi:phosphonate transport system substrate-binding protein